MKSRKIYDKRHQARDDILWDDIGFQEYLWRGNKRFRCQFLCLKKPCKRQRIAVRFLNKYNRKIYYSGEWIKEI